MPVSGLHLDAGDPGDDPDAPLGLTVNSLDDTRGTLTVRVPLDGLPHATPFCIFGTPEQLYRLASELAGVVDDHLRAPDRAEAGIEAALEAAEAAGLVEAVTVDADEVDG